jgi:hypothetical protein
MRADHGVIPVSRPESAITARANSPSV